MKELSNQLQALHTIKFRLQETDQYQLDLQTKPADHNINAKLLIQIKHSKLAKHARDYKTHGLKSRKKERSK